MNQIEIVYLEPLGAAWSRMKDLLFRPFDLTRWMVIGFTAWLAQLGKGGGATGNFPFNHKYAGIHEIGAFLHQYLMLIIGLATGVLLLGVVIGLLVAWLGARGKFMFLDNALTGPAAVGEPWRRWRKQGNSLFLWRIAFGCILLGVLLVIGGLCVGVAWPDIHARVFNGWAITAIVAGFLLLLPTGLVAGYIMVLLDDFVVPLMRKHDLKTNAAWHLFLPLWRAQIGPFLLYGLIRYAVGLLLGVGLIFAGCLTCCCLFCIAGIPYAGTVLLLPLHVWKRYWGVEFMRQFGPDYDVWVPIPAELKATHNIPDSMQQPGDGMLKPSA